MSTFSNIQELKELIEAHLNYTGSLNAERILNSWAEYTTKFIKVYPKDYRRVLEAQKTLNTEAHTGG